MSLLDTQPPRSQMRTETEASRHLSDNQQALGFPTSPGMLAESIPVSPQPLGAANLQDYQMYLMMMERTKSEELGTGRAKCPEDVSIPAVKPQRPWSPTATRHWIPFHILNTAAQPRRATSIMRDDDRSRSLTDYQSQLMVLEEQNRIRLERAKLAHADPELCVWRLEGANKPVDKKCERSKSPRDRHNDDTGKRLPHRPLTRRRDS